MGYPTRLLGSDERIVMSIRPHWKELVAPAIVFIVSSAIAGALLALVPDGGAQPWLRLGIGIVWLLILLRWPVWQALRWWFTQYTVTNRRLIVRTGVLSRAGHDIPLQRINDVAFEHTWFERLLGCGTLQVESAGERGQLVLRDIPHVEDVQRDLYELVMLDHRERVQGEPDAAEERGDGT